jgi:hypothetical protein
MNVKIMSLSLAACATVASAGTFFSEVEDNNTLALANDIGTFSFPGGSVAIDGTLTEGDVDWFAFSLTDAASLSFFAAFSAGDGDGVMQLVTGAGDVIAFDDDSGVGLMPAIQVADLAAGDYFIGFSGFGDVDSGSVDSDELADGIGHDEDFGYKLSIGFSIVPAPGSLALLGLGGVVMTRRRR